MEKEKNAILESKMEKLALDLACWRADETVNSEQQINIDDIMEPSTGSLEVEATAAMPEQRYTQRQKKPHSAILWSGAFSGQIIMKILMYLIFFYLFLINWSILNKILIFLFLFLYNFYPVRK